jgi:hypothetical protein
LWIAVGCSDSSEATFIVDHDGSGGSGLSGASTGGGTSQSGGATQSGGRAGATDAGPDAPAGDAGARGTGGIDAGADADAPDDGPGVLVAYDIRSTERKLYVLDAETGRPLSSEAIGTVRAVLNDGATYPTDRWYVFEQASTVDRGLTVRVRSLDARTGAFRDLGELRDAPDVVAPPVSFVAAGKSFVAYLSEVATGPFSKVDLGLIVVDATDEASPKIVPVTGSLPSGPKLGLVAEGDSLNVVIVQAAPCPTAPGGSQQCNVSVVHADVTPSTVSIGTASVVGKTGPDGNASFATDPSRHLGVVGLPPVTPPTSPTCDATSRSAATVSTFSIDTAAPGTSVSIPVEAPRFAGAAFDSCSNVLFLTSLADDVAIWAVPLGAAGTTTKLCAGSAGGPIVYDAPSRSLFRAVPSGALEAYRVDANGAAPKLTPRPLPELPGGFRFGALATRNPKKPACR